MGFEKEFTTAASSFTYPFAAPESQPNLSLAIPFTPAPIHESSSPLVLSTTTSSTVTRARRKIYTSFNDEESGRILGVCVEESRCNILGLEVKGQMMKVGIVICSSELY
eukprot:TRINITY_DN1734_c0_g1_i1.p1 TRINITY_DN1734_c0_g1~~TRINITY_DN1734_c0_g1_i1.p1  ORF type:complete len:109 (-),score=17.50 TRINITY_DN1734_c0_g1_i1:150-476(-)